MKVRVVSVGGCGRSVVTEYELLNASKRCRWFASRKLYVRQVRRVICYGDWPEFIAGVSQGDLKPFVTFSTRAIHLRQMIVRIGHLCGLSTSTFSPVAFQGWLFAQLAHIIMKRS